jgi:predicted metal-dependent TIM-barrel fold hydrolase
MPVDNIRFINPHVQIVSRTANDYQAMRAVGVVAVIEPVY